MSKPTVRESGIFDDLPKDRLVVARARSSTRQRATEAIREEAKQVAYNEGFDLGQKVGYSEGFETGRLEAVAKFGEDLSEELKAIRMDLEQALARLEIGVSDFYLEAEGQLSSIAKEVVTRVLAAELQLNEEAILGIVKGAISEVSQSREVTVRVTIADSEVLSKHRDAILRSFTGIRSFEIIADSSLMGGCIVASSHGDVDATTATMLRLIEGEAA
ncbi:MAG: hypothetical protein IT206_04135 [Fimbriimonadaceae bacterium]|nr:hypothetical protein [Fimbriimonadaceae bacterium]